MDSAKKVVPKLSTDLQGNLSELLSDAQATAHQVIQSVLDTADSVAGAMGVCVATRCHAWLRGSDFSPDVQATPLDLPFNGSRLFGANVDSALHRFKDTRATARSLGLRTQLRDYRQFLKFQGYSRNLSYLGRIGSISSFRVQIPFTKPTVEEAEVVCGVLPACKSPPPPPLPLQLLLQKSSSSSAILEQACPGRRGDLFSVSLEICHYSPLGFRHRGEWVCPTLPGITPSFSSPTRPLFKGSSFASPAGGTIAASKGCKSWFQSRKGVRGVTPGISLFPQNTVV